MLGPLPPYVQLEGFLPASELARLLDWTLANEGRFKPAKVTHTREEGPSSVNDPGKRIPSTLRDLGPVEDDTFRDYGFALNCWSCRKLSEVG